MTLEISMRPSSRAGRFKKKLVSLEQLKKEAGIIEAKMAPVKKLYQTGEISSAELVGLFIIQVLSLRHPKQWLGSKRTSFSLPSHLPYQLIPSPYFNFEKNIQQRLKEKPLLQDVFSHFALKAIPEEAARSLLRWSSGDYPLELMFRIPSPQEVLAQQKHGKRCVSVLTEATLIEDYILGERDTLSFTLHDLVHADRFYAHPISYQGQLGFYALMDWTLQQDYFQELMSKIEFKQEVDYFVSDMNAYPIHLLKCLKSAIIHYGRPQDFQQWIEAFPTRHELNILLTAEYNPRNHDSVLLQWLENWKI